MTKLEQAAVNALADLVGEYESGGLPTPAQRTLVELYEALNTEGSFDAREQAASYFSDVERVRENLEDELGED